MRDPIRLSAPRSLTTRPSTATIQRMTLRHGAIVVLLAWPRLAAADPGFVASARPLTTLPMGQTPNSSQQVSGTSAPTGTQRSPDLSPARASGSDAWPRRSSGAYAGGMILAITGATAVIVGTLLSLPFTCGDSEPPVCGPLVPPLVGASTIANGGVSLVVGIPLAVWGGSRVQNTSAASREHVGPRGLVASWDF